MTWCLVKAQGQLYLSPLYQGPKRRILHKRTGDFVFKILNHFMRDTEKSGYVRGAAKLHF
jgi:hypothetical protein